MKFNSLAFRLFATAAAWTLVVLPVAGLILHSLYRQEAQQAFDRRLEVLLTVILADSIDHAGTEPGAPRDTGEPLFEIPLSGWYWQITPLDGAPGRRYVSPSLASEALKLPSASDVSAGAKNIRWSNEHGPNGEEVRVAELIHLIGDETKARRYSYAVAGTLAEVDRSVYAFRTRLILALALAGVGLVAVTLFQVRFGLKPLQKIEQGLAAIRSGKAERLEGDLPAEIEPLQHELNALLQSNRDIIERARTQVGNLAHALKTPLAVILNEAREDKTGTRAKIADQARKMGEQINHYLDRARVAARAGVIGRVTEVKPVAEGIVRALGRIYCDRGLELEFECAPDVRFQGERQDLEEMLGNLLDNACKWATSRVKLTACVARNGKAQNRLLVDIDDDGPGLSADERGRGFTRGRRLDETKPGSGLGLSIVADLAHSYHGELALDRAPTGGLRARLELPSV
jgi:signal transduction histidine kinase